MIDVSSTDYSSSQWDIRSVRGQFPRHEGAIEVELEKLGYTLRLVEKDKTWKIIAGIIHDFETAIAL
jgi:hypothetical protein